MSSKKVAQLKKRIERLERELQAAKIELVSITQKKDIENNIHSLEKSLLFKREEYQILCNEVKQGRASISERVNLLAEIERIERDLELSKKVLNRNIELIKVNLNKTLSSKSHTYLQNEIKKAVRTGDFETAKLLQHEVYVLREQKPKRK